MDILLQQTKKNKAPLKSFIKKNFITGVLIAVVVILLLVPGAKVLVLKTFVHTGLLNAPAKKGSNIIKAGTFSLLFIDEKNEQISITALQGKVVFINFWATWCPPCVAEMGSVNALYNKLKDDPRIVFIMADADNNPVSSLSFMKRNGYHLPVYRIALPVSENLFTGTIPATLIIDARGNIVQRHEGIANYNTNDMVVFLRSLL